MYKMKRKKLFKKYGKRIKVKKLIKKNRKQRATNCRDELYQRRAKIQRENTWKESKDL